VAYAYYDAGSKIEKWHMPILEKAFAKASNVLADTCGATREIEEKLAVLIYSEGKKRLQLGLGLRHDSDAEAVALVAIRYFWRAIAPRTDSARGYVTAPSARLHAPLSASMH
jgi:hypothetical protein